MKNFQISTAVQSYRLEELPEEMRRLVMMAREATYRAYAPYSHFKVGAAVLLSNGEIVTGSNQENAAFPSGTCAERTAAYYAHATYPDAKFKMIAISARGADDKFQGNPISPCGACRQSLLEYETLAGENVKVLLDGERETLLLPSIRSLLPFAFSEF